jgi:hypothetical protein
VTIAPTGAGNPTVFRAFEPQEFLEWPVWARVRSLLASNGGSYGLSGPRGAGKSWLMLRAVADARNMKAIGLWYPSPSEYDPYAFLASLIDGLAGEIEHRYRRKHPYRQALRSNLWLGIAFITFSVAAGVTLAGTNRVSGWTLLTALLVALALVLYVALMLRLPTKRKSAGSEENLLREALIARERARYTATRRESTELGTEAGRGLLARARASRERELVERPATLSSLVNDFRGLAKRAADVTARVVIAIDELDKMDDADKVRALLRDIKGIFEVPGVHFFVSVSDEAARSLNLGALTGRNEFNSSFYTVIELQPATPEACAELLQRRAAIPRDVALVLAILAGGNPREVIRLAEIVGATTTGPEAAVKVLREEALSLRRDIVTAVDIEGMPSLSSGARSGAFNSLPDEAFDSPTEFIELASSALEKNMWEPGWSDAGWDERFAEAWRRLLIRTAVAGDLIESPSIVQDVQRGLLLQDVVVVAGQSAEVARVVLERRLRVEVRDVGLEAKEAREKMDLLAQRYEQVRASMTPGDDRTSAMEKIMAEARSLARDAEYETGEIGGKLRSDAAGDRIIGLAAIEATGNPETLDLVLDAIRSGHPPFEQFHALQALESLRPGLSKEQRSAVVELLSDKQLTATLSADSDRARLMDRLRRALAEDTTLEEARSKRPRSAEAGPGHSIGAKT